MGTEDTIWIMGCWPDLCRTWHIHENKKREHHSGGSTLLKITVILQKQFSQITENLWFLAFFLFYNNIYSKSTVFCSKYKIMLISVINKNWNQFFCRLLVKKLFHLLFYIFFTPRYQKKINLRGTIKIIV